MVFLKHFGLHVIEFTHPTLVNDPQSLKGLFAIFVLRDIITGPGKDLNELVHLCQADGLIDGQTDPSLRIVVKIEAGIFGYITQPFLPSFILIACDLKCIKELRILLVITVSLQHLTQIHRFAVDAFCNLTDTFRAVVHTVHTCHHSREGFGGTDVRCCAFALDMLLACLERQTVSRTVVFVFTQTDDTSRHVAFVFVACSHVSGCRTTKAHRQTETLRRTTHDIRIQRFE